MAIASTVSSVAARGVYGLSTEDIIQKNTRFIRNKYLLERYGIQSIVGITEKLYELLNEYDKEILNFAQKYSGKNIILKPNFIDIISMCKFVAKLRHL
jgi:hypothetical protein